jgi:DNA-binding response OmpR family regulator
MNKILIIGRDLNFVWALKKMLKGENIEIDHIFTISEAKARFERTKYDLIILDNLKPYEMEFFLKIKPEDFKIITIDMENSSFFSIQKEIPHQNMLSYLKNFLNF